LDKSTGIRVHVVFSSWQIWNAITALVIGLHGTSDATACRYDRRVRDNGR